MQDLFTVSSFMWHAPHVHHQLEQGRSEVLGRGERNLKVHAPKHYEYLPGTRPRTLNVPLIGITIRVYLGSCWELQYLI